MDGPPRPLALAPGRPPAEYGRITLKKYIAVTK